MSHEDPTNENQFPRIISSSNRLTPDHSGDICPICGCGGSEDIPYCECDNCSHWIDEDTYLMAKSQYGIDEDYDPSPCEQCIFEVRQSDGLAKYMCWACIVRTFSPELISRMRECPECLIFQEFDGEMCSECARYGAIWSRYRARRKPELETDEWEFVDRICEPRKVVWGISFFQEDEDISDDLTARLEAKGLIGGEQCGARKQWHMNLGWLYYWKRFYDYRPNGARGERPLSARSHYQEIKAVLMSEEVVDEMFRYSLWHRCSDVPTIDSRLEDLGIEYTGNGCGIDPIIHYFTDIRNEDLQNHPQYGPYFRAVKEKDIDAQVTFLLGQDLIPDRVISLLAERITNQEDFMDYLLHGSDFPPEFRILILESISMSDLNSNWQWR